MHCDTETTLGEFVRSYMTIKKWITEFKHGLVSFKNDPRSGCHQRMQLRITLEKCMSMADYRLTFKEVIDSVDISYECKQSLCVNKLRFYKVSQAYSAHNFSRLFGEV